MNAPAKSSRLSGSVKSTRAPSLPAQLKMTGFRIRSATRADCVRCTGRSANGFLQQEVAHCFRCDWGANWLTLARDLGVLLTIPQRSFS